MQLLEFGPQLPFEVRVDDRERLVEHDDIDIGAHQSAAERNFLLAVGGQPRGALVEHALRSSISAIAATFCSISARGRRRLRKGKARFSHTVMVSYTTGNWNTWAIWRRSVGRSVRSMPSNRTLPSVGRTNPEMMLSSVVLP